MWLLGLSCLDNVFFQFLTHPDLIIALGVCVNEMGEHFGVFPENAFGAFHSHDHEGRGIGISLGACGGEHCC